MKKHHIFILTVTTLFLFPIIANATSLIGTRYTTDKGKKVKIEWNGHVKRTSTVQFETQVRDDNGELINGGEWFKGFCVDIGQSAKIGGESDVNLVAPSLVDGGLHAAWLMANRDLYMPDHGKWSNYEIGGLQLAIWEVTHDYSETLEYTLDTGAFKVRAAKKKARDLANFYLESLAMMFDPTGLDSKYMFAQTPTYQDFIIDLPDNPVPEPATMLLLGLGLLGLAGIKRRVNK